MNRRRSILAILSSRLFSRLKNGSNPELTNFPGSYGLNHNGGTVTVTGVVGENARGPYEVVLAVTGVDNNKASAKATIDVVIESSSSSSSNIEESSSSDRKNPGEIIGAEGSS